jgi:hypothetical protein
MREVVYLTNLKFIEAEELLPASANIAAIVVILGLIRRKYRKIVRYASILYNFAPQNIQTYCISSI